MRLAMRLDRCQATTCASQSSRSNVPLLSKDHARRRAYTRPAVSLHKRGTNANANALNAHQRIFAALAPSPFRSVSRIVFGGRSACLRSHSERTHCIAQASDVAALLRGVPKAAAQKLCGFCEPHSSWTALHVAAAAGHCAVAAVLLRHGAAVRATDSCGMTPLHWAARKGKEAAVRTVWGTGELSSREAHSARTCVWPCGDAVGSYLKQVAQDLSGNCSSRCGVLSRDRICAALAPRT